MGATPVTDPSPVRDCPLNQLQADGSPLTSVAALRGKNLGEVRLRDCTALTDLSPLQDCTGPTRLTLPLQTRDIEFLRTKPGLLRLSYSPQLKPAAEFWKEYDEKNAAGK